MDIVGSFADLLQVFAVTMTPTTFGNLRELAVGWVFAPRRTIMGMLRAGGSQRHHSAFHRLFASAKWSVDGAGLAVYDLIRRFLPQAVVFLAGDDTLLNRRGLKIFGSGMHRDPLLSSRGFTVTRWGHCWVVLCVVIESPRTPGRHFALPILARLYLNKKSAEKWRRTYRTKPSLMLEMLQFVHAHDPQQKLHFLGDSAYTSSSMLNQIPLDMAVCSKLPNAKSKSSRSSICVAVADARSSTAPSPLLSRSRFFAGSHGVGRSKLRSTIASSTWAWVRRRTANRRPFAVRFRPAYCSTV